MGARVMERNLKENFILGEASLLLQDPISLNKLEEAIQQAKQDLKRKEILERHPYSISKIHEAGRKPRYATRVKANGRLIQIKRNTMEELLDCLIHYYEGDQKDNKNTLEKIYPKWQQYRSKIKSSSTVRKDIWSWNH